MACAWHLHLAPEDFLSFSSAQSQERSDFDLFGCRSAVLSPQPFRYGVTCNSAACQMYTMLLMLSGHGGAAS